jgi:hypothetical protein
MNKNITKKILAVLLFFGSQVFCTPSSSYVVSKEELASICALSTTANFAISIEMLQLYPISDTLLENINDLIAIFWNEYALHVDEITIPKKEFALKFLKNMNKNMQIRIQNLDINDPQVKALVWIMWGYALLVIHYQIMHTLT